MRTHLLVIDPQNDFCDPTGSLYVPGADKDMGRLAKFLAKNRNKIDDIHVSLDSHRLLDISHPMAWLSKNGKNPPPFTMITHDSMVNGEWRAAHHSLQQTFLDYLKALEARARYPHVIWPPHCLIGSFGHNVYPDFYSELLEWERRLAMVDFITKGSNPWTEHFSAVQAEVVDPMDPSTSLNMAFMASVEKADQIIVTGQALSHCVANTVLDIANAFSDPTFVSKIILLTDTCSQVPNPPGTTLFEDFTAKFLADMQARGMRIATSDTVTL